MHANSCMPACFISVYEMNAACHYEVLEEN